MKATFDADHLLELLALSEAAIERRPTFSQMLDPDLWSADMDADRRKEAMKALEEGGFPRIHGEDIDDKKVPAGLMLVGDEGIYFMSNARFEEVNALQAEGRHVAYARETDPKLMSEDEAYDNKRAIFGGDDGVEFIAAEELRPMLVPGSTLEVDFTPESIALQRPVDDGPQPG